MRPRRNLDHIVPNWLFLRAIRVRLPASVLSPLTDIRQHVFTVHPTAKAIVINWRYYVCRDSSIVDIWLFSNQSSSFVPSTIFPECSGAIKPLHFKSEHFKSTKRIAKDQTDAKYNKYCKKNGARN